MNNIELKSLEGYPFSDEYAREHINKLSEEIEKKEKPLVYIDGAIPTTKDDVLATLTVKSKWLNFFAYIKIKCQGSSSMAHPKKNFTVTLYQDETRTIPLMITIPGWKHPSNKFVFKANWIDRIHARNVKTASIWSEIVASRPDYDTLPVELRNSPNNGAVDGFPIIVYTNGDYQGLYTWNIGKDAWMWGMDEDNPNHVLMCAETNTNFVFSETPCNFRALWSGVHEDYWSVEVGTNSETVKNSLNALIACVKDTDDDAFRATISNYLDVLSAIDYYLLACADCGIDSLGKNMLIGTYDLRKWYLGAYDLDSTWGLYWDGTGFVSSTTACPGEYQETFSLLFDRIVKCFKMNLIERAKELRRTVLSVANINTHFERFVSEIGAEAYADDLVPYPDIPSSETNNIWKLRNFVKNRLSYFDSWIEAIEQTANYEALYPLKDGVFRDEFNQRRMTITRGNHVKIETMQQALMANFTIGAISVGNNAFKNTNKLFTLKTGDVVRREINNIVTTGSGYPVNGQMSQNLYGPNGEIRLEPNDISLPSTGNEHASEITITQDTDVTAVIAWVGGNTLDTWGSIEFDLCLYVNDVRYV